MTTMVTRVSPAIQAAASTQNWLGYSRISVSVAAKVQVPSAKKSWWKFAKNASHPSAATTAILDDRSSPGAADLGHRLVGRGCQTVFCGQTALCAVPHPLVNACPGCRISGHRGGLRRLVRQ